MCGEGLLRHRGWDQFGRSHEAAGRAAPDAGGHHPSSFGANRRYRERRPSYRRARHEYRYRSTSARTRRLPRPWTGDPGRSDAAIAQQGNHGRQSVSAHALLLFHQCRSALQQAGTRFGLRSDPRNLAHPRSSRYERPVHRHLSRRYGGGAFGTRCLRRDRASGWGFAQRAGPRIPPPPWRYAVARQHSGGGRSDHGGRPPPARRGQAPLPQGPRTVVLCFRAGVGRRGGSDGGRTDRPSGPRLRGPCAQTLARSADQRSAGGRRALCGAVRSGRGPAAGKRARAMGTTISKIPLARRTLAAVLAEATGIEL